MLLMVSKRYEKIILFKKLAKLAVYVKAVREINENFFNWYNLDSQLLDKL